MHHRGDRWTWVLAWESWKFIAILYLLHSHKGIIRAKTIWCGNSSFADTCLASSGIGRVSVKLKSLWNSQNPNWKCEVLFSEADIFSTYWGQGSHIIRCHWGAFWWLCPSGLGVCDWQVVVCRCLSTEQFSQPYGSYGVGQFPALVCFCPDRFQ